MNRYRIHVSVDPRYRRRISGALLRRWAQTALDRLALPDGAALEIAITDDQRVQALNRDYRGLDEPTDVLSFPFTHRAASAPHYGERSPEPPSLQFPVPPSQSDLLGEIVISFPYAQRQAVQRGQAPDAEVALLLIHGLLHLVGYDHHEPEDERAMTAKTHQLLEALPS